MSEKFSPRYAPLVATLGAELFEKVHSSKILLIGAGGIGCELIKNLVLSGFIDIEVIDLDTIDVSNLNRQFLFRPRHVGMPKAVVAREMCLAFNPEAKIVAHHANIKEQQFGLKYFEQFTCVLNALDNIDARRHVNRLCLATSKTLIEAGTTGFDGQAFVIAKGQTACYECEPKPTQKVYPICTIRSTPDKPVHCVVWAKELFKLLFGNPAESLLDEPVDGPDESTYMPHVHAFPGAKGEAASLPAMATYCRNVFGAIFNTEVAKQLAMDKYKSARFVPEAVDLATINAAVDAALPSTSPPSSLGSLPPPPSVAGGPQWDRQVWSPSECLAELCGCVADLWGDASKSAAVGKYAFDKDDKISMRFVAAAANLRGSVFKIESLNFHDVKGVAGNIIPAIATTNAIVAGQQVHELFKVLDAKKPVGEVCKYTYWRRFPSRQGHLLQPTKLDPPNPKCYVCSQGAMAHVYLDTSAWVFEDFLAKVVKGRLGFNEPTVSYASGSIWEEGDDADEEAFKTNLPKKLDALPSGGVVDGVVVGVDDYSQDMELQLRVHHLCWDDVDGEAHPESFHVGDNPPKPAAAAADGDEGENGAGKAESSSAAATLDSDEVVLEVDDTANGSGAGGASESRKRPAEAVDIEEQTGKKARS